jgi:hypothetical protein
VRLEWRETCVKESVVPAEGTGLALVRTLVAIDLEGTARFEFVGGTMACVIDFFPGAGACPVSAANGAVHT